MKSFGYLVANPAEYLIHQRFGKLRYLDRGVGCFVLPVIDRVYRIPSNTQNLSFSADQITFENQGVEVSGFACWKIKEPEKSCHSFDFTDPANAVAAITGNLTNVLESAIRHQVAKMSIEEVLRKRGSIILQLKQELAYVTEQWGLEIETVEIKNIRIMSAQLFANMQAKFRDEMRLLSETSALAAEQEIATRKASNREQLAESDQEFKRREAARKTELDTLTLRQGFEMAALRQKQEMERISKEIANQTELSRIREESCQQELRFEELTQRVRLETQRAKFAVEVEKAKNDNEVAAFAAQRERQRIAASNDARADLAFIEKLPETLEGLEINQLNLGDNVLTSLAQVVRNFAQSRPSAA